MKRISFAILFALFFGVFGSQTWAGGEPCPDVLVRGTRCKYLIADLHPTQFSVGLSEVENKVEKFSGLSMAELKELRLEKRVPVVLGPGKKPYLIDHHHTVLAFAQLDYNKMYIEVLEDFSTLPEPAFWAEMKKRNWVYLFDSKVGELRPPQDLPNSISALADDPYRAFASRVRDAGGFGKTNLPFYENTWARYFRAQHSLGDLDLVDSTEDEIDDAVEAAAHLARQVVRGKSCPVYLRDILDRAAKAR